MDIRMNWFVSLLISFGVLSSCSKANFDLPQQEMLLDAGVTYNNKVDILLMVDNSSSMLQYQRRLESQVDRFVLSLNQKALDYRIAVVSSDLRPSGSGGRLIGSPSYLTSSTPDIQKLLRSRIVLGQTGSDIESGLGSLRQALSNASGSEFLRSDALLAMVILTNEDDYSLGSISEYRDFFDSLKTQVPGFTRGWILNFIGVISIDGNCRTTADFKEVGLRYMTLSQLSGGINASICDTDLSSAVSNLEKRIVQILSEYKLEKIPDLTTLRVYINEVLVPQDPTNGWVYLATSNSIQFQGNFLPKATDRIRIDYKPDGGN
jgi:hypothetical protein